MLSKHNACLAWLSSEGGLFDTLAGRYSKGVPNLDLFLKAHAGESDRVDRLSRESVSIQCARLTIGLSPQPDVLSGLVDQPGFMGRGLFARFLYLLPASNVGYRTLIREPIHEVVGDEGFFLLQKSCAASAPIAFLAACALICVSKLAV